MRCISFFEISNSFQQTYNSHFLGSTLLAKFLKDSIYNLRLLLTGKRVNMGESNLQLHISCRLKGV